MGRKIKKELLDKVLYSSTALLEIGLWPTGERLVRVIPNHDIEVLNQALRTLQHSGELSMPTKIDGEESPNQKQAIDAEKEKRQMFLHDIRLSIKILKSVEHELLSPNYRARLWEQIAKRAVKSGHGCSDSQWPCRAE